MASNEWRREENILLNNSQVYAPAVLEDWEMYIASSANKRDHLTACVLASGVELGWVSFNLWVVATGLNRVFVSNNIIEKI